MVRSTFRLLGFFLLVVAIPAGCGEQFDGTYEDAAGFLSIEFRSGKAYLTTIAGTSEATYTINGDKIILRNEATNLVLTVEDDGTLSGAPLGSRLTRADM